MATESFLNVAGKRTSQHSLTWNPSKETLRTIYQISDKKTEVYTDTTSVLFLFTIHCIKKNYKSTVVTIIIIYWFKQYILLLNKFILYEL